ncbi:hypothetical protein ACWKT3_13340 [Streptomyces violaceus]
MKETATTTSGAPAPPHAEHGEKARTKLVEGLAEIDLVRDIARGDALR